MNFKTFLLALSASLSFTAMAQNDDLEVTIQNQRQDGTNFTFDIYANTSAGTTYLGDGDIVFSTAAAKWSSLAAASSNVHADITALSASIVNGDVVINLQGDFAATTVNDFVAIGTTPVRLATITLTDVSGFEDTPDFTFITNGNLKTDLFEAYLHGSGRLRQSRISGLTLTAPAAGTAPVAGPANFAVDMVSTPGQADLTWDAVSDSVLVVARASSANATSPVNTVTYTGNAAFGSGEEINTGGSVEYVVGKLAGSTTSLSVTGLNAGTTYHFAIYNYTGGSGFNEAYGPASTATGVTLFAEPTTVATNLSFSNVAETSFDLSWTQGDGDSVLVVVREAATGATAPTDATGYAKNSSYSAGDGDNTAAGNVVVYSTVNTTSLSVTGLSAATEYAVDIYEYNGTGSSANYLATALSGTQYSMFTQPTTVATNLTFTSVAPTSFTANWTSGNGDSVLVVARLTANAAVTPTDGTEYNTNSSFTAGDGNTTGANNIVMYAGPNVSTLDITGLTAGMDYTIDIYEYNGSEEYSNYNTTALSGAQTTQFNAPTTPGTNLVFSDLHQLYYQIDWTSGNGTNVLIVARESGNAAVTPTTGTGYSANTSFTAADGDNTGANNVVLYSGVNISTFVVTGLTAGTEYAIDIYEYNGSGVTASYNTTALSGSQHSMYPEPSTALAALTATTTSANSVDVTWTDPSEAANNYVIIARLSTDAATAPDSATDFTANAAYGSGTGVGSGFVVYNGDGSAASVSVTGLDQNETYAFDIYAYTGAGSSDATVYNYANSADANGSDVTWLEANITAVLEGPYDGTDMSSVNITVPSAQPYNTAPWSYAGSESNGSMPAGVVDWILLELRTGASAATASTVVLTQAALLLDDGSIVAADGSSLPEFEITAEGDYYVAIHHRNHLAASSAAIMTDNGTSAFSYDFTSAGATGTDAMFDYTGAGFYVLFGGWVDPTTDATINAGDNSAVYTARNNASATYDYEDANMDGAVNAADRTVVFNNRDYATQVP